MAKFLASLYAPLFLKKAHSFFFARSVFRESSNNRILYLSTGLKVNSEITIILPNRLFKKKYGVVKLSAFSSAGLILRWYFKLLYNISLVHNSILKRKCPLSSYLIVTIMSTGQSIIFSYQKCCPPYSVICKSGLKEPNGRIRISFPIHFNSIFHKSLFLYYFLTLIHFLFLRIKF